MRRSKIVSKKLAVVLLSASLGITPVFTSVAMPVTAFAAEQPDNQEGEAILELDANDDMENNNGKIVTNNGSIENNNGDVEVNNGFIENNTGTVEKNTCFITNNSETGIVKTNEKEVTNNNGIVESNDQWIVNNNGSVGENNQHIENNTGTVDDNNGSINVNAEEGKVVDNNRTITQNNGYVENNKMVVTINDGQIDSNYGIVAKNNECVIDNYGQVALLGGYVTVNKEDGIVYGSEINPGSTEIGNGEIVYNLGGTVISGYKQEDTIEIENYYYGDLNNIVNVGGEDILCDGQIIIKNSFGEEEDTAKDFVTVEKQFNCIEVVDAENVDVTYNNFSQDGIYGYWFVQTKENSQPVEITGTINLKAKEGYELSDNGQLEGEVGKLVYGLSRNEDGSYTVNIASLTGNIGITPEMLNLIVSEISKEHGEVTNVVVNNAASSDNSSDNNQENSGESAAPSTVNFNDVVIKDIADQVQAQMNKAGQDAASLEVVDIYFKDKIAMSPNMIKYLCESIPVAKRCHFDYQGKEHVLFIPAFDVTAPAYAEGLKTLENEPSKTAGFYRIKDIFKDLKFDAKIVETPVEETTQD